MTKPESSSPGRPLAKSKPAARPAKPLESSGTQALATLDDRIVAELKSEAIKLVSEAITAAAENAAAEKAAAKTAYNMDTKEELAERPLPPGWVRLEQDGRPFFYNTDTGEGPFHALPAAPGTGGPTGGANASHLTRQFATGAVV